MATGTQVGPTAVKAAGDQGAARPRQGGPRRKGGCPMSEPCAPDSVNDTIVFRGRFITIHLQPVAGGKTDRYTVTDRDGGLLAWVRYYSPWRRWCFLPCEGTVWSEDCLADVRRFIARLGLSSKEFNDGNRNASGADGGQGDPGSHA